MTDCQKRLTEAKDAMCRWVTGTQTVGVNMEGQ
uniref:Uncharacterized protein n=1 Tax=Candidatus Kentrum sp. FW TaxID=2126338 RepID=A0A450TQ40_9GAMM|nr:MAG: hypothetical protein BECKFW1821C_GA0114237_102128 [Candidatus Kentron sp. FW]